MTVSEQIQLAGTIVAAVAAVLAYAQIKSAVKSLGLNAVVSRHDMFFTLTQAVTPDMVRTVELHLADNFDLERYRQDYAGRPLRIESYALMKRKYLYIYFLYMLEEDGYSEESGVIANRWLTELAKYYEFADFHASQGKYYGGFKDYVDRMTHGLRPERWMVQEGHEDDPDWRS